MLSGMRCLYISGVNPLSVISFADIFSHLLGCLFILLIISFAVQKPRPISLFLLYFLCLGETDPNNMLLSFMLKTVDEF